jgi:hypothetical protein
MVWDFTIADLGGLHRFSFTKQALLAKKNEVFGLLGMWTVNAAISRNLKRSSHRDLQVGVWFAICALAPSSKGAGRQRIAIYGHMYEVVAARYGVNTANLLEISKLCKHLIHSILWLTPPGMPWRRCSFLHTNSEFVVTRSLMSICSVTVANDEFAFLRKPIVK